MQWGERQTLRGKRGTVSLYTDLQWVAWKQVFTRDKAKGIAMFFLFGWAANIESLFIPQKLFVWCRSTSQKCAICVHVQDNEPRDSRQKYFNHFADRKTIVVNADNLRKMTRQAYKHRHTWIKMGKMDKMMTKQKSNQKKQWASSSNRYKRD